VFTDLPDADGATIEEQRAGLTTFLSDLQRYRDFLAALGRADRPFEWPESLQLRLRHLVTSVQVLLFTEFESRTDVSFLYHIISLRSSIVRYQIEADQFLETEISHLDFGESDDWHVEQTLARFEKMPYTAVQMQAGVRGHPEATLEFLHAFKSDEDEITLQDDVTRILSSIDAAANVVAEPLERLTMLDQLARSVTPSIVGHMAVAAAEFRAAGGTWKEIGDHLGTSPQAAQQRFEPTARQRHAAKERVRRQGAALSRVVAEPVDPPVDENA